MLLWIFLFFTLLFGGKYSLWKRIVVFKTSWNYFHFLQKRGREKKPRCYLCFHPTSKHLVLVHCIERIFAYSVQCQHIFSNCFGTMEESCPSTMPPFSSGAGCIAPSLTQRSLSSPWTGIMSQVFHEESSVYQKISKQRTIELQLIRGIINTSYAVCGRWNFAFFLWWKQFEIFIVGDHVS